MKFLCLSILTAFAAIPGLDAPESVYVEPTSSTVYVSNVAGMAGEKDGKGWIAKFANGKVTPWVKGLNAPKGMRSAKGLLWVSDIDEILAIDMKSGKISQKLKVEGAKFLNDVAVGPDGTVYVSDMMTNKIHAVTGNKVTLFAEGESLENPNGLLVADGLLYVASWGKMTDPKTFAATPGHLYSLDLKTKARKNITTQPLGNLDGLERTANGEFLVSDWVASKVYLVKPDGKTEIIAEGKKNAADIGLDPKTNTLYIPWMGDSELTTKSL